MSPKDFLLLPSFSELVIQMGFLVLEGVCEAMLSDFLLEALNLLVEVIMCLKYVVEGGFIPIFYMLFEIF